MMAPLTIITEAIIIPFMLSAPPTSIRNFAVYATKLAGKGRFFDEVITKIKLAAAQNKDGIKYSKLDFFSAGDIETETKAKVKAIGKALKDAMRKREISVEEYKEQNG